MATVLGHEWRAYVSRQQLEWENQLCKQYCLEKGLDARKSICQRALVAGAVRSSTGLAMIKVFSNHRIMTLTCRIVIIKSILAGSRLSPLLRKIYLKPIHYLSQVWMTSWRSSEVQRQFNRPSHFWLTRGFMSSSQNKQGSRHNHAQKLVVEGKSH